ncbi:MAG: hypothetical protein K2L73_03150 [Muribaculaceae bacterium]|nr:hypothetical protein [Muribaculaceae bacterium]
MAAGKIKRNLTIALASALICSGVVAAESQKLGKVRQKYPVTTGHRTAGEFGFVVTGIVEKPDDNLVRVCGTLTGTPNTSGRIDRISLVAGDRKVEANDIDGVDFERYFIWEDEGSIYLEIDFPEYMTSKELITGRRECNLIFHTVKGDVAIPVANNKHKKKK